MLVSYSFLFLLIQIFNKITTALICRLIIQKVCCDSHDAPDKKYSPPAPLLTATQRVLLCLMLQLEPVNMPNIFNTFLIQSEETLLSTNQPIECIIPLTRLYLAVCRMKKDIHRMRRTVLDGFYFMGDLVIPFLYTVLTSWAEVLPTQEEYSSK